MLVEILNLAPGVCVLLALGALLYVTRTQLALRESSHNLKWDGSL
jgi:hypothetical protein